MARFRTPAVMIGLIALLGSGMQLTATTAAAVPDGPPSVIPAVQQHEPGEVAWSPSGGTRVLVSSDDAAALSDDAETLAAELRAETGHPVSAVVTDEAAGPGDVRLTIGEVPGTDTEEAYSLRAGEAVAITGPSDTGVFWGTRTLLQALRVDGGIAGVVTDEPGYSRRALQVDVARKYFTPEWLEERIRELSYLKMNTLHLHLSDNLGFRVEIDSHPEIVTEPALTKADIAHLVEVAERYHVTLIPEVDSPGHLDAALAEHPELQLVRADGSRYAGHLDYSKPEARTFVKDIIGELADMFPGPWFHIGGDEYFGAPWQPIADHVTAANSPQLMDYARAATGSADATLLDGFDAYMNELVDLLDERGKRAMMWNDHIEPGEGVIDVDTSVQVEVWIRWRSHFPSAEDFIDAGYDVVNANGDHLYFIITPDGRNESGKKSPSGVYELWTPRSFMQTAGGANDLIVDESRPVDGAHLSVWADQPDSMTQDQVATELGPWLRSFAQNIWDSPKTAETWAQFEPLVRAVGAAPVPGEQTPEQPVTADFPWLTFSPAVRSADAVEGARFAVDPATRILIDDEASRTTAEVLATQLARAAGLSELPAVVEGGDASTGDVVLTLTEPELGEVTIPAKGLREAYRIDIDGTARVSAATVDGLARGATSLAKGARFGDELAPALVIDAPAYTERSVMLDVGRKYYSPEWVKDFIEEMAWNQLNTLHLHLNDNEGFRVVVPSHPDTASPDAWTAEELEEILATAKRYRVDVIPEIDGPGHMDWILRNYPEYQLKLSNGTVVSKALDYSNPEAEAFLRTIISETMAMFPDSDRFHLGGDEYFLSPIAAWNTPQLLAYAREKSGNERATVEDGATYFINGLADFVAEAGRQPRVWNDGVDLPNAIVPLDKDIEVEIWSVWGHRWNQWNAQDFVDAGYTVVNAHGDFYFIIRPEWDNIAHAKHSPRGIYDVWAANGFMNDAGGSTTTIPTENPQQRGAGIHVWADDPEHLTPGQVWDQLVPWLLPLGQRTWDSPNSPATYAEVDSAAFDVAHPGWLPMAPAALELDVDASGAHARWQAPVDDGGARLEGYRVIWTVDGVAGEPIELGAEETSIDLDDVAPGEEVTVQVYAVTESGASAAAALAGPKSHVVEPTPDPTDPTPDPTDPTDPIDPTEPTDPTDPTDPTGPTDPGDPTAPTDPTDPSDPTDPTGGPSEPDDDHSTGTGGSTGGSAPGDSLPDTGATPATPLLIAAGLFGVAGLALVIRRRVAQG